MATDIKLKDYILYKYKERKKERNKERKKERKKDSLYVIDNIKWQ
jgi:hypothetical protein